MSRSKRGWGVKVTKQMQDELFEMKEGWEEQWQDMPEFIQLKQEPFACINIRFENEEDLKDFAEIIGQKLTPKTKSIWHPFKSHWGASKKVYKSES